jgi:hypothetical protein
MHANGAKIVPRECLYFKNENGFISEWLFDHETLIEDNLRWYLINKCFSFCRIDIMCLTSTPLIPLVCLLDAAIYFNFAKPRIKDEVHAHHVCLTKYGVIYIVEKHKSHFRLCHCDYHFVDKKTMINSSFEKITDVSVEEPVGRDDCCFPNKLYTVTIQTTHDAGKPFVIVGLKDPLNFKKEVMRLKEEKMMRMMQQHQQTMIMPQSGQQQQMMPQAVQHMMYTQQAGQPQIYAHQAGQPQIYAQQAGQPQIYAQQAGQPQIYAQQAGQPNTMHIPEMVYAQPVPMEMDRGMK